jgi:hypothetical protein
VVGLLIESVCLTAMIIGVALIGRSPSLAGACEPVGAVGAERADSA